MRFLCRLGWHKWVTWKEFTLYAQRRNCWYCGLVKERRIKGQ